MAASHMAIVRSSARMANQKNLESSTESSNLVNLELASELSQASLLSFNEGDDISQELDLRSTRRQQDNSSSGKTESRIAPKILTSPLERIETISDIEAHLSPGLSQWNVLRKLEQQWLDISLNFERVLDHLQECSGQVVEASTACLDSLKTTIELTCDKADEEARALYFLMEKCDELTTKLSVASTFRDEVKTLRKSVESLENLYKSRPRLNPASVGNFTGTTSAPKSQLRVEADDCGEGKNTQH